jgi:hypothetical protein
MKINMKKLLVLLGIISSVVKADEGMWMPQLVEALNFKDMKKNGFKLTAQQLYSINKASMKDAVAIFGGGCTGEMISSKGLLLTNHHCGFGSIAALSTVQKDYLKNGYWAKNNKDELYCENLKVTFIKRIDDVTKEVMAAVKPGYSESQKDSAIKAVVLQIEKKSVENTHYSSFVRPFYYGNEYYLFITEVFKDVRLVGTPPENIGKFGGETDNWVWPRHNPDFSMFRIYAGKDNKPAEYSEENIPYKPAHFFPVSMKGYEKGDFTMVYGFPGRTQEYLTSYAVDLLVNEQNPRRVSLREKRLAIYEKDMKKNDTIRLMYANRYAGIANAYKKWSGETLGLKKYDAVNKKKNFEKSFLDLFNNDAEKKTKYTQLMKQFEQVYKEYAPLSKQVDYYAECLLGIDALRYIAGYSSLFTEAKKKQNGKENKFDQKLAELKATIPFKNFNKATDMQLSTAMLSEYIKNVDFENRPPYLDSLIKAHQNDPSKVTAFLYSNTNFVDNSKVTAMLSDFEKNFTMYERDPFYVLTMAINNYYQKLVLPQYNYDEMLILEFQKEYMAGLKEHVKNKTFYPDANGTLRIAYGKVEGYKPKDGVEYQHYTTIDGMVEKNKTGNPDYEVMPRLVELYEKKDFGPYTDKNGKLRVSFIASNHTTGGNSGSPVLNAKGELIGTNYDRNWEGTMSDVMYDVSMCRNIVLDVRFTLWVIDKYAGAGYLLNEMKLVK